MLFVLKTTYLIMPACAEPCCADSPTFAKPCCADSPNSPTFAEPCCADSPNSPTFAKPFTEYSPDSPRHIRTSNSPFSRIWGEWPLLKINPKISWTLLIINVFEILANLQRGKLIVDSEQTPDCSFIVKILLKQ
jgi:hypothetical protein